MKKFIKTLALSLSIITAFSACSGTSNAIETASISENAPSATESAQPVTEVSKIVIGATIDPHAQILYQVVDELKEKGIELEVKEFTDWQLLNTALAEKEIDANFFQHLPYLEKDVERSGDELISIGFIHTEPLGVYSKKITKLDELPDNAQIAIPDDDTNGARALLLLEANGLFKLKEGIGLAATKEDIVENPKNITILPQEAAIIPRSLQDVDLAVINGNYALNEGLNPMKDSIVLEDGVNNPYANVIAVRQEDKDRPALVELIKALQSDKVRNFIDSTYSGAVIPAF